MGFFNRRDESFQKHLQIKFIICLFEKVRNMYSFETRNLKNAGFWSFVKRLAFSLFPTNTLVIEDSRQQTDEASC